MAPGDLRSEFDVAISVPHSFRGLSFWEMARYSENGGGLGGWYLIVANGLGPVWGSNG
jgi:hypothetical protein